MRAGIDSSDRRYDGPVTTLCQPSSGEKANDRHRENHTDKDDGRHQKIFSQPFLHGIGRWAGLTREDTSVKSIGEDGYAQKKKKEPTTQAPVLLNWVDRDMQRLSAAFDLTVQPLQANDHTRGHGGRIRENLIGDGAVFQSRVEELFKLIVPAMQRLYLGCQPVLSLVRVPFV